MRLSLRRHGLLEVARFRIRGGQGRQSFGINPAAQVAGLQSQFDRSRSVANCCVRATRQQQSRVGKGKPFFGIKTHCGFIVGQSFGVLSNPIPALASPQTQTPIGVFFPNGNVEIGDRPCVLPFVCAMPGPVRELLDVARLKGGQVRLGGGTEQQFALGHIDQTERAALAALIQLPCAAVVEVRVEIILLFFIGVAPHAIQRRQPRIAPNAFRGNGDRLICIFFVQPGSRCARIVEGIVRGKPDGLLVIGQRAIGIVLGKPDVSSAFIVCRLPGRQSQSLFSVAQGLVELCGGIRAPKRCGVQDCGAAVKGFGIARVSPNPAH